MNDYNEKIIIVILVIIMYFLVKKLFRYISESHLNKTQKNFRHEMERLTQEGKVKDKYGTVIKNKHKAVTLFDFFAIIIIVIFVSNYHSFVKLYNTAVNYVISDYYLSENDIIDDELTDSPLSPNQKSVNDYINYMDTSMDIVNKTADMVNNYLSKKNTYTEMEIDSLTEEINMYKNYYGYNNTEFQKTNIIYGKLLNIAEIRLEFLRKNINVIPDHDLQSEINYTFDLQNQYTEELFDEKINLLNEYNMNPTVNGNTVKYTYNN